MKKSPDRCYFCGTLSQYNFRLETPVCGMHWDMMYNIDVPKHVPDAQLLNYKKLALEKRIWKV